MCVLRFQYLTYDAGKGEREDEVEEKGFLASRVKLLDLVESVRL